MISNHNKEKGKNKRLASSLPTTSVPPSRKRSAVEITTVKGPQTGSAKTHYQAGSSSQSIPNTWAGSSKTGVPKSKSFPINPVESSSSRSKGKRKANPYSDVIDLCGSDDSEDDESTPRKLPKVYLHNIISALP